MNRVSTSKLLEQGQIRHLVDPGLISTHRERRLLRAGILERTSGNMLRLSRVKYVTSKKTLEPLFFTSYAAFMGSVTAFEDLANTARRPELAKQAEAAATSSLRLARRMEPKPVKIPGVDEISDHQKEEKLR